MIALLFFLRERCCEVTSFAIVAQKIAAKIKNLNAIEFKKYISVGTVIESGRVEKLHVCITYLISIWLSNTGWNTCSCITGMSFGLNLLERNLAIFIRRLTILLPLTQWFLSEKAILLVLNTEKSLNYVLLANNKQ